MKSGHWSAEKQVQWSLIGVLHNTNYPRPARLHCPSFFFCMALIWEANKEAATVPGKHRAGQTGWQTSKSVNKNSMSASSFPRFFFSISVWLGQKKSILGGDIKGQGKRSLKGAFIARTKSQWQWSVGCFLSCDILYHHLCDRTNSISGNYVACKSYRPPKSGAATENWKLKTETETQGEGQGLVLDVY